MSSPTRIPASLNEEDLFLVLGPIKLSLREMIAITFGITMWYMLGKIVGLAIFSGQIWGLVLLSPILYLTWVVGKKQKDGKPFEYWLADKIVFTLESRQYTLLDKHSYTDEVDDVRFTIEEQDDMGDF